MVVFWGFFVILVFRVLHFIYFFPQQCRDEKEYSITTLLFDEDTQWEKTKFEQPMCNVMIMAHNQEIVIIHSRVVALGSLNFKLFSLKENALKIMPSIYWVIIKLKSFGEF